MEMDGRNCNHTLCLGNPDKYRSVPHSQYVQSLQFCNANYLNDYDIRDAGDH